MVVSQKDIPVAVVAKEGTDDGRLATSVHQLIVYIVPVGPISGQWEKVHRHEDAQYADGEAEPPPQEVGEVVEGGARLGEAVELLKNQGDAAFKTKKMLR